MDATTSTNDHSTVNIKLIENVAHCFVYFVLCNDQPHIHFVPEAWSKQKNDCPLSKTCGRVFFALYHKHYFIVIYSEKNILIETSD